MGAGKVSDADLREALSCSGILKIMEVIFGFIIIMIHRNGDNGGYLFFSTPYQQLQYVSQLFFVVLVVAPRNDNDKIHITHSRYSLECGTNYSIHYDASAFLCDNTYFYRTTRFTEIK